MPADSELTLPHTFRPLGVRVVGIALGILLLVMLVGMWLAMSPEVRDQFGPLQRITAVALGVLGFAVYLALLRSRLVVTDRELVVVNGYRKRTYEWAQVITISLPRGAPWAVLDLADGTTCPVMGIQGSDGERARRDVRRLRALLG